MTGPTNGATDLDMAVVGPCLALALLIVAVNLVSDAYIRQLDRSSETQ